MESLKEEITFRLDRYRRLYKDAEEQNLIRHKKYYVACIDKLEEMLTIINK